jgi:hypothetical protein
MWFSDPHDKYSGEYHMYGGICWPKPVHDTGTPSVRGHVVLLGENVDTRHHYLFDETAFIAIDHVYRGNEFLHRGVSQWFTDAQRAFGPIITYWWGDQPDPTFARFYRLLSESPLMDCASGLRFGKAQFAQESDPIGVLYERIQRGVIHTPAGSEAGAAADVHRAKLDQEAPPALHALLCAVAGDERCPWYDRAEASGREEVIVGMKQWTKGG